MKNIFLVPVKSLITKSIVFLAVWIICVEAVNVFKPDLLDWSKLVTNILSNAFVFWIGYVLTVLGFTLSNKRKK